MKNKIAQMILNSKEEFISGEEIANKLNISRTAVWKNIKTLKEQGYKIESVNKKGYRLSGQPEDILNEISISHNLDTEFMGQNIVDFETIDSTNDYAKKKAYEYKEGTVIISEEQTLGRGRLGRTWKSNAKEGIWMSILLKPNIQPYKAPFITMIAGASLCEALVELGVECYLKWPNDVIVNSKKIGGILTELSAEIDAINYVVLGIGINIKTDEFDEDIKHKATSLYKEGYEIKRVDIIRRFMVNFEKLYLCYIKENKKESTVDICKKYSCILDKEVYVCRDNNKELVKCIDINEDGDLVIQKQNGEIEELISGEISIRGVDRYV